MLKHLDEMPSLSVGFPMLAVEVRRLVLQEFVGFAESIFHDDIYSLRFSTWVNKRERLAVGVGCKHRSSMYHFACFSEFSQS
jgi:hypothetical protein